MQEQDIIIIGGGLAGLSLSIQLAQKGRKVIVFEKETYPFHKVCGEYISMQSMPFLKRLGLDLEKAGFSRITKLKISSSNGTWIEHTLKPGGFGISRFVLEELLYKHAQKAGVKVLSKSKVEKVNFLNGSFTVKSAEFEFAAPIVIGAYGKRSNIEKELNKNISKHASAQNHIAVKYHLKADLPKDVIELHYFKNGYCGISAIEEDKYCLCYLTTSENLKRAGSIELLEKNVLSKNPILKRYLKDFDRIYPKPLTISNIDFSPKRILIDHVLMAGDSAGLITPLCGNGMSMAFHSSAVLSEIVDAFLDNKITRQQMENEYSAKWNYHFSSRLKYGRFIQYVSGFDRAFIPLLKTFPFLTSQLISLASEPEF